MFGAHQVDRLATEYVQVVISGKKGYLFNFSKTQT